MRKIIYQRSDGGISIVTPVINSFSIGVDGPIPIPENITEADAEKRAWDKLPTDAINPRYADEADIPTDRTFRDAWKHDLSVDMGKAREIHRKMLRAKGTVIDDAAINAALTPDELKTVIPAVLVG